MKWYWREEGRATQVDRVTVPPVSETPEFPDTGLSKPLRCSDIVQYLGAKDGTYSNMETTHDSDSKGWLRAVAMLRESLV